MIRMIVLIATVALLAGLWRTFQKAGWPGWAALIPIYNVWVLFQIAGKPWWWMLALLIPFVNLIVLFLVSFELSKRFGQQPLFAVGLTLLGWVFYPILGFGPARYQFGLMPVERASD